MLIKRDNSIFAYVASKYNSSRNAAHGTIMMNANSKEVIRVVIVTYEETSGT